MDYSQKGSVFMPGLTTRGPVYNALGALPALSSTMKLAIVGGLLAAGLLKKIPLMYAGIGAAVVWTMFPDAAAAAPAAPIVLPPPDLSQITPIDFSNIQAPAMPPIAAQ